MKIEQTECKNLTAKLLVKISANDYTEKVDKVLNDYRLYNLDLESILIEFNGKLLNE